MSFRLHSHTNVVYWQSCKALRRRLFENLAGGEERRGEKLRGRREPDTCAHASLAWLEISKLKPLPGPKHGNPRKLLISMIILDSSGTIFHVSSASALCAGAAQISPRKVATESLARGARIHVSC